MPAFPWRAAVQRTARDRGAAAVEFALVVPFLFLLVFGIVDFSRAYNARISLSEAAAEGSRALAIGRSDAEAQAAARTALAGSTVPPPDVRFVITGRCSGSTRSSAGAMRVTWTFQLLTPIPAPARQFDLQGVGARQCAT